MTHIGDVGRVEAIIVDKQKGDYMVQKSLPIHGRRGARREVSDLAAVVGVSSDDEAVTLRFLAERAEWGQTSQQVRLDRGVAEELCRMLNYELELADAR